MASVLLLFLLQPALGPQDGNHSTLLALEQATPHSAARFRFPFPHRFGPVIPGLHQGAIPQGLTYMKKEDWLLVSYYFDDKRPSMVCAIDMATGRVKKSLTLIEADGRAHTGHVGGITTSAKHLWIGSGRVYRVPLKALIDAKPIDHLRYDGPGFRSESEASTLTCNNQVLWVGEFVEKGRRGSPHHVVDRVGVDKFAWVSGYRLNADDDVAAAEQDADAALKPDFVFSVCEKLQGLTFKGNQIILSVSYGRGNKSRIVVYRVPNSGARATPDTMALTSAGAKVPRMVFGY